MADIVYDMQEKLREKINSHNTEQLKTDDEYYYAVGQLINYSSTHYLLVIYLLVL